MRAGRSQLRLKNDVKETTKDLDQQQDLLHGNHTRFRSNKTLYRSFTIILLKQTWFGLSCNFKEGKVMSECTPIGK